ncbi:lipopolysaccharide assembly protein LapB [Granulosicoccaceae sp. 1_MG-2023]|nr:lipopolysaccharide assembly protein LapB [Granulosicoccaceae sp. 1_MG-2023]
MLLNLLWLLLPVAYLAGWWSGRKGAGLAPACKVRRRPSDARSYVRGLNYLISEQQDKAIDLFVGIDRLDQEMVETQLALGNLFRNRGQFDHAIRIHENLVTRAAAHSDAHADALLELAADYSASGLFDRAEEIYGDLLNNKRHADTARDALIGIFEREKDWPRAIRLAEEQQRSGEHYRQIQLGHYYCELAEQAVRNDERETARLYLKKALAEHPASARANILRANLAMGRGDYSRAIECYTAVEKANPDLAPEIISPLLEAFERAGDTRALKAYIRHVRSRNNAYSVIRVTQQAIRRIDGDAAADRFFKEQILKRPSLKGLRDWAQSELDKNKRGEKDKFAVIINMLDSVVEDKPAYVCSACGFEARSLHWQCPSCGTWDSVRTFIGAEGE